MTENEASTFADDDRISSLPDEILYEILERLRSPKQVAKAALLCKRWNHLWLSYPVLEFNHNECTIRSPSRSTMNSFIAAAKRKFSSSGLNSYIKSVRISSRDSAFIGATLDLIQNREPESIDMSLCSDSVIPTQLLNSSRLRTLELDFCELLEDQYKMINLRVIHLSRTSINNRVLKSVIAAAPLLEKLILMDLYSIQRVEVCNHANLKHLQIWNMFDHGQPIQIVVGALYSLETFSLHALHCLEIICFSELPSLKSVQIIDCFYLRHHAVNKLISKSPSLLSLRLVHIDEAKELKIESSSLQILELEWFRCSPKRVFRIDAPRLVNVHFSGYIDCLHAISHATNSFQAAQIRSSTFELSLHCYNIESHFCMELKELLRKVTPQFQFVQLQLQSISTDCDEVEDDSPTPVVERVKVKLNWGSIDHTFLYNMLWTCQPKYLSLYSCDVYTNIHPSIEVYPYIYICIVLRLSLVRFLTN
ncbi:F-box/FBD/LRR-repeat protein At1g51370 [Linum perenne]